MSADGEPLALTSVLDSWLATLLRLRFYSRAAPPPSPQLLTALLFQPALLFLTVLACLVFWPLLAPSLAWVPGVGPWLAGPAAVRAFTAGPRGVLTRRLEHVSEDRKERNCFGASRST